MFWPILIALLSYFLYGFKREVGSYFLLTIVGFYRFYLWWWWGKRAHLLLGFVLAFPNSWVFLILGLKKTGTNVIQGWLPSGFSPFQITNRRSHREKIFQQTIFCHFFSLIFSPLLSSIIHSASPHLETEVKRFQSGSCFGKSRKFIFSKHNVSHLFQHFYNSL